MYVVSVVPFGRRAGPEVLTFFSKDRPELGVIVQAPVRGASTPALVVEVADALEHKLELKDKSFALKKIVVRSRKRLFTKEALEAFRACARFHALPLREVLTFFTPAAVVGALDRAPAAAEERAVDEVAADRLVLQAERDERVRMYRNLTRECFARGESLLVVASTLAEVERLALELNRGIEDQVIVLSSALTKKSVVGGWSRAATATQPVLIICTPSFVAVPCPSLSLYIVERESARGFIARERPHLDARVAVSYLARERRARLLLADFPLRIETRAALVDGSVEELMRLQVSAQSRTRVQVIDARTKKEVDQPPPERKKSFSVFTDRVVREVRATLERGARVFLYTQRRGLAPLTVCNDCGTPVVDPGSGAPMTLHKTPDGNIFMSYRTGLVMPSTISCSNCGSWNLVSLGIGVDRVVEEVETLFPDATLCVLTADTAPTHAKAKKVAAHFFNTPRSVLVGTDRALPYLADVPLSVVVSMDSLLSLSAWRAHAYGLHTLFFLRDNTEGVLLVQTRLPTTEVMRAVAVGNPTDFTHHELNERREFGYPPFATFIGLTWSGTEKMVTEVSARVAAALADSFDVVGPLPPRMVGKNRFLAHAVVRLKPDEWPHEQLLATLSTLAPDVSVTIDPDEIV